MGIVWVKRYIVGESNE